MTTGMTRPQARSLAEMAALWEALHPTALDFPSVVQRLADRDAVLGAMVGGSYAYGVPRKDSDLDVALVVSEGPTSRVAISVGPCCVDLWTRTETRVRREFERQRLPGTLEIFCFGVIVADPHGLMRALQSDARRRWSEGPPVGPFEIERRASRLRHLALMFDTSSPGAPQRIVLRAAVIDEIVSYWYVRHRRYQRAPAAVMDDIATTCPQLAHVLELIEREQEAAMQNLVRDALWFTDNR